MLKHFYYFLYNQPCHLKIDDDEEFWHGALGTNLLCIYIS